MLTKITELTDVQLLETYRKTKNKAHIGELYRRYEHLLFGVALRQVNDMDVAKEIVLLSFDKLFDDAHQTAVQVPRYWLLAVVKNTAVSYLRSPQTEMLAQTDSIDTEILQKIDSSNVEIDLEKRLIIIDDIQSLSSALDDLPPLQRQCLTLFYYETMTYKEIAHLLNIDYSKVKTNIQSGKIALKKVLQT